jgi:DnaJ-class molecular chaperone
MPTEKHTCQSCKGKGHVFDAITLLHPVMAVMAIFQRNDMDGITRQLCGQCDGDGWVVWKTKKDR